MNSFEFAINMELDGEKYYMEQAEINKGNELNAIFIRLAKDEKNHAKIFQNKLNKLSYELKDNNTLSEFKDVFKGIGDFKNEIKKIPNQLDLYRNALEKEKQSIELYKNFYLKQLMIKKKRYLNI
ncbi:hypothetical protein CLCAR_2047 [Clostridium carboxidivorans P7]|uniref:ferritin-like domain-containing protein n=1 Tax=Clostridium carboxidivorans TaxID=217159 RepID=UPI0001D393DA|nr:hypothetical protein CLCAR_2047 [Clostridium carboxidivorans P7]